jgi:hypothetical protein
VPHAVLAVDVQCHEEGATTSPIFASAGPDG